MNTNSSKLSNIFKILLATLFALYCANTGYKFYEAINNNQDLFSEESTIAADISLISLIVIVTAIFYSFRWYQRKDERDFIKKYKKD